MSGVNCEKCHDTSPTTQLRNDGAFVCTACFGKAEGAAVGISADQLRDQVGRSMTEAISVVVSEIAKMTREVERSQAKLRAQMEDIRKSTPKSIMIKRADGVVSAVAGHAHKMLPALADLVVNRNDVYLWGPAGGGKNTACEQVASAAGFAFHSLQLSLLSMRSELMGYVNPVSGAQMGTPFTDAYTNGGLFLADELDNWNPSVVASINSALANGYAALPWGTVPRHADFVFVGAGNTDGLGSTLHYGERRALPGATRDRLVQLHWPIDEKLEIDLATDKAFAAVVQDCRKANAANGDRLLITPRATLQGCQLLARGWKKEDVAKATILRGQQDTPSYLGPILDAWYGDEVDEI